MDVLQNYTCVNGAYDNNMALATLFDASCGKAYCCCLDSRWLTRQPVLADGTEIAELPQKALSEPNPEVQTNSCQKLLGMSKVGHHYFQNLSPDAESATPTFDLRSTGKGDYISVSKDSAVADASSGENVAWLQLSAIEGEGSLSKKVFRTYPAGGVPPETVS